MIDDDRAAANRAARRERKQAHLRALYDRHVGAMRALDGQEALSVARRTHAVIDGLLARDREKDPGSAAIRCGRGCSHCCLGPVEIGPQEAALLVRTVREAGGQLDEAKLERQSRYDVERWREQPPADRTCVFLGGDGACTVYASRPDACRKLLVTSDPALCDADRDAPEQVERWFSWEAELMASAALEVFGVTLMPKALLAAWRDDGVAHEG